MPHPFPAADGSSPQTRQFSDVPEMGIDPAKRYTATMETSHGTMVIALDPIAAPKTVEFIEAIPLTAVGKANKRALRARFWGDEQRSVH